MDPLSIIAGVTGIAGFTDTIITKTYNYIREVKNAEASIHRFFNESKSLYGILTSVQHTLELMSEDNLCIESSVGKEIDACKLTIKEIRDALVDPSPPRSSLSKFKRRMKWPFDIRKTEELTSSLERHKTTLNIAFSIETLLYSFESSKKHSTDLSALRGIVEQRFTSEDHQKIFAWLGNIDHAKLQVNGINLRSNLTEQTGTWFLEGDEFKNWLSSRGANLWVHGIPGSGKTVLTSTIVQHIQALLQARGDQADGLAYFYCDFKDKRTQTSWNIIGSLIRQLGHQNTQCLYDLEDFFRKHDPSAISSKPCTVEDLAQFLRSMTKHFDGDLMIIIDGLDEIEEGRVETIDLLKTLGEGTSFQAEGISSDPAQIAQTPALDVPSENRTPSAAGTESGISTMGAQGQDGPAPITAEWIADDDATLTVSVGAPSSTVKLLLVSRTLSDIGTELQTFAQQGIEAKETDLLLYVSSEIHYRMSKGRLRFKDRGLKDDIVDGLVHNAQGMFRWVVCQIDHLCKLTSDKQKRNALNTLPRGLPDTYDRILYAVDERHIEIVHKTLQWIISAAEPLPIDALLEALAVADGDGDLDEDQFVSEDTVLGCCSSLVKRSGSIQGVLELAHFSVKQYLMDIGIKSSPEIRRYQIRADESRLILGKTCLTYLNFQSFDRGPVKTIPEFTEITSRHPFLQHAAMFWDTYSEGYLMQDDMQQLVMTLFDPSVTEQFRFWNQCVLIFENEQDIDLNDWRYKACMEASPLHWAAMFALPEVTRTLLRDFSTNEDSGIGNPIHCALLGRGFLHLKALILKDNVDSQSGTSSQKSDDDDTCLLCSAKYRGFSRREPQKLHCGHIFELQCDNLALDPTIQDCPTCQKARLKQHTEVERFMDDIALTKHGLDIGTLSKDSSWRSVNRLQTLSHLIDCGCDLNSSCSALPRLDIVKVSLNITDDTADFVSPLLKKGAKISRATIDYAQRLVDAALKNNKRPEPGVATLIMNSSDCNLAEADREMFKKLTASLRSVQNKGSDLFADVQLGQSMTATERKRMLQDLKQAVRLGLLSQVKTFLGRLTSLPLAGQPLVPLQESFYLAVERNRRDIAELFLENGAIVDRRSFATAVIQGNTRTVDLFLEHSPEVACQEDMSAAISLGAHGIFSSLLRIGIKPDDVDDTMQLPIHWALKDDGQAGSPGRLAIIEDLMKLKPSLTMQDCDGELPIHLAVRLGLDEVVKACLDRGASVESSTSIGLRPTHIACIKDSTKIMKVLIQAGADINAKRGDVGGGPLLYAASYNACGCAQLLLEAGADAEQLSALRYTPLIMAALKDSWDVAAILIRAGVNVHATDEESHSTTLMLASASGAIEVIQLLLEKHPDLDLEQQNINQQTPLFLARSYEVLDLLLRSNAQVDANRDKINAGTPLHKWILKGSIDSVQLLLDHNANIESVNSGLQTPLMNAAECGQWKIVEMLVQKGANVNVKYSGTGYTPLTLAAASGKVDMVTMLLDKGANTEETASTNGYTALMLAAQSGSLSTVKVLVEKGADILAKDNTSACATALIHAIERNVPTEIVEYLLLHGANASDREAKDDKSVLMVTATLGNEVTTKTLLAHGANIDCQTRLYKSSALSLAVDHGQAKICKILLEHGAVLSQVDSIGRNIAHHIARYGSLEVLKEFLPYPVDWTRSEGATYYNFEKDSDEVGVSPLHLAAKYRFPGFIRMLHDGQHLLDLDPPCGGNLRPLHWAAALGNTSVVEILAQRGVNINAATEEKGHTPLHLAAKDNHLQTVRALIKFGANVDLLDTSQGTATDLASDPDIIRELRAASKQRDLSDCGNALRSPKVASQKPNSTEDPRMARFIKACDDGNIHECRKLLSLGVSIHGAPGADCSPLLVAIKSSVRNNELVSLLIDNGADINAHAGPKVKRHGYQPIHYATWNNSTSILRKLLNTGARMSDFGLEPIHIAAYQGSITPLTILLEHERSTHGGSAQRMLDVQVRDQEAFPEKCLAAGVVAEGHLSTGTALHLAAYASQDKAIATLIENGAKVDASNSRGYTALHLAASRGTLKTLRLLLDNGADINARTLEGNSPFLVAVRTQSSEMIDELVQRGSDITAKDNQGRGAVHHAIYSKKVLSKLQELGIPFDLPDIYGQTPLQSAFFQSDDVDPDEESVKYLIEHTPFSEGSTEIPLSSHGNGLNMACAFGVTSVPFVKAILERLRKEKTPEFMLQYVNHNSQLYGSPMYAASFRGEVEVMTMLLEAGTDLSTSRGPLGSALNASCSMGRVDAIKWLLKHGCGPVEDDALQLASRFGPASQFLARYNKLGDYALSFPAFNFQRSKELLQHAIQNRHARKPRKSTEPSKHRRTSMPASLPAGQALSISPLNGNEQSPAKLHSALDQNPNATLYVPNRLHSAASSLEIKLHQPDESISDEGCTSSRLAFLPPTLA